MSLEDNKTIVRRFVEEALTQGNFDVYDTSFAPNFVAHYYNTPSHDHASFRKFTEQFHQAISGHTFTIHDLIAEGDTVAARFSYAASMHHAQFGNTPPSGQPLQMEFTLFAHFEQGKITEAWGYYEGANWDLSPT